MAVSIEHSCSQKLNCRGIRLLRRVLVGTNGMPKVALKIQ
jgi:hypothetical protein